MHLVISMLPLGSVFQIYFRLTIPTMAQLHSPFNWMRQTVFQQKSILEEFCRALCTAVLSLECSWHSHMVCFQMEQQVGVVCELVTTQVASKESLVTVVRVMVIVLPLCSKAGGVIFTKKWFRFQPSNGTWRGLWLWKTMIGLLAWYWKMDRPAEASRAPGSLGSSIKRITINFDSFIHTESFAVIISFFHFKFVILQTCFRQPIFLRFIRTLKDLKIKDQTTHQMELTSLGVSTVS